MAKYARKRRSRRTAPKRGRRARRTRRTKGVSKRRKLQGKSQTFQNALRITSGLTAGKSVYDATKEAIGALGGKRAARMRTGGLRKRKREDEGTGSYAQWTQAYKSARFGRLTGRKVDRLSTERVIFTHRRIGPFNDYGQLFMANSVAANGIYTLPLVLFELNSCNNVINGVYTDHNPVRQLYQTGTSVAWTPVNGQVATGGTASEARWQLETSSHGVTGNGSVPLESAIHKWSSLDLELWGCRNKPTKYMVQLVQFSEDVLPDYNQYGGAIAEFWQSIVKHYTYSPLAKMDDGFNRKKMKILKQYKFNIDPTANFENDPDPHVKTLKLYYKFNRMCNFMWKFNNETPQTVADMQDSDWKQEANQVQTQVHPNARIYVMIRASNFTTIQPGGSVDNTTTPSISWRLRTCYMINN